MEIVGRELNTHRKQRTRDSGVGKLTILVFGLMAAVLAYGTYRIGPFYYSYFELENQAASLIRVASTHTNREILDKLMYHVKKLEVPLDRDQILIERTDDTMRIYAEYDEVLFVSWQGEEHDLHTFEFTVDVEGRF